MPRGASIGDKTWTEGTAITPFTLPRAAGYDAVNNPQETYRYRAENLPAGVTVDDDTLTVSGTPVAVQTATAVKWIVTDSADPTWHDELTFNATVNAGALRWVESLVEVNIPLTLFSAKKLAALKGGSGRKTYSLTPTAPAGLRFNGIFPVLQGNASALQKNVNYTLTARDEANTSISSNVRINVYMTGLALLNRNTVRLLDFQGNRLASMDFIPDGLNISLGGSSPIILGASASPSEIALLARGTFVVNGGLEKRFFVYDRNWTRISSKGTTLSSLKTYTALAWCPLGYWLIVNTSDDKIILV